MNSYIDSVMYVINVTFLNQAHAYFLVITFVRESLHLCVYTPVAINN